MSASSSFRSVRRNLPYIRSELGALVGNLSLSVKSICICVICSYMLSHWQPAVDALSVTPGHLLPPSLRVWTLLTSPFLEIHLWEVCVDIITVGLCGKLLEPLWGAKEMIFFFVLVNLSVSLLSVGYYLFLYAATSDPDILFEIQIHGLAGYIAAVSVAVRQIMPDHVIVRTPLGKLTNRNIPLTVLTVLIITWAIGLLEGVYCTMFATGVLTSWIYLRFYQRHSNGSKGDIAESFNFASFFPNVLQPPISVLSNSIFGLFVKVGCCRKPIKRFADASGPSSIQISLPGSDPSDAERRRQKALKLLNERMNAGSRDPEAKRPLIPQQRPDKSNRIGGPSPTHSMTSSLSSPSLQMSGSSHSLMNISNSPSSQESVVNIPVSKINESDI
ncbi:Transmembrane protein [Orchesella cincta]|uniref:Transmembrane protein n=1 Tax=Orchesella cincta TaxID=48709 RepID=A0A1D2N5W6_ORCCI|nr:Transmembrane protein [Orchesella cincta]